MNKKNLLLVLSVCMTFFCTLENVRAKQVKVVGSRGNWQLTVDEAPFYIKGAGFGKTVHAGNIDYYFNEMKKRCNNAQKPKIFYLTLYGALAHENSHNNIINYNRLSFSSSSFRISL